MLAEYVASFSEFVSTSPTLLATTPIDMVGDAYVLIDGPVTSWVAKAADWAAALDQPVTGHYGLEPDEIYAELVDLVPYERGDALRYEQASWVHRYWA